jgi:hypothetical protein
MAKSLANHKGVKFEVSGRRTTSLARARRLEKLPKVRGSSNYRSMASGDLFHSSLGEFPGGREREQRKCMYKLYSKHMRPSSYPRRSEKYCSNNRDGFNFVL